MQLLANQLSGVFCGEHGILGRRHGQKINLIGTNNVVFNHLSTIYFNNICLVITVRVLMFSFLTLNTNVTAHSTDFVNQCFQHCTLNKI